MGRSTQTKMLPKFSQISNFRKAVGKQVEIENCIKQFMARREINPLNTNYLMLYAKNLIKKKEPEQIIELNKWALRRVRNGYLTRIAENLIKNPIEQTHEHVQKDEVLFLNFYNKEYVNPWPDLSGYKNNGVAPVTILAPTPEGVLGRCCYFNGVDYYLDCGTNPVLAPYNLTFMLWIKPEILTSQIRGLATSSGFWGGFSEGWRILYGGTEGQVTVQINFGDPGPVTVSTWYVLKAGQWNHIGFSYDHQKIKLFNNGKIIAETEETRDINWGNIDMLIGAAQQYTQGWIDEVRYYPRALSEEEIKEIYNAEKF